MRILFVKFGDYREAAVRLSGGGPEMYGSELYMTTIIEKLTEKAAYVGVISVNCDPYDQMLANGVHTVGMKLWEQVEPRRLVEGVRRIDPTLLFMLTPIRELLQWAAGAGIPTLPILADTYCGKGIRQRIRNLRLANILNHSHFRWIANHNINACRWLKEIGVDADKLIPWDWPHAVTPDAYPAKEFASGEEGVKLIFVGMLSKLKGLMECINALKYLRKKGMPATLTVAGPGDPTDFERCARRKGIGPFVHFTGRIPHARVPDLMHAHDAVLVPSRHAYSEALPLTITEAFCSRTPLIASDHPMFLENVVHLESGLIFKAGHARDLAAKVLELAADPRLYARLSINSASAWKRLFCPVKWGDLISRFISGSGADWDWFHAHSLSSGLYGPLPKPPVHPLTRSGRTGVY